MTKGRDATTSSTRTFMPRTAEPVKQPRKAFKLPSLPKTKLHFKASQWLIIALVVFSIFMIFQYRSAKHKLQAATPAATTQQVNNTIARVGKLILLPTNETPVVKTVVHADKLKGDEFFAQAKDGDKVLIYDKAKKAILYRPSQNIIVNVANVSVSPTN